MLIKIRNLSVGLLFLCLSAPWHFSIFDAFPITLQSLSVIIIGLLFNPGQAFLIVTMYLLLGGLGLPVFAKFSSGWQAFTGATAAFLFAFPLLAIGLAYLKNKNTPSFRHGAILGFLCHLFLLVIGFGGAWLFNLMHTASIIIAIKSVLVGLIIKSLLVGVLFKPLMQFAQKANDY